MTPDHVATSGIASKGPGRTAAVLWGGICGALLVGCMGLPVTGSSEERARVGEAPALRGPGSGARPADRIVHVVVPFFPDATDQCGPAALASVLTYWGIPTDPGTLKTELYLPRLGGTLPTDLLLAAQARGLDGEFYSGGLKNVRAELDAGHPLVVLLNLGYKVFPRGHYVVITGYDDHRRGLYVHSGQDRDVFLPYERFLRVWDKTGRWTLLVLPRSDGGARV